MEAPSVGVIGTGYVGLTSAACLARLGRQVTAIDIDESKIERLRQGEIPILEEGLDALVVEGLENGRLRFDTSYNAIADCDVVLLCLPTPFHPNGDLDLSYVEAATGTLREVLKPGAVVVTKSTVPVGSHVKVAAWLNRDDLSVASNPEFLREGTAVSDFLVPDRVVVGAETVEAAEIVARMYDGLDAPIQITDTTSAELIKYAANTFLATKLSFVNELSRLCEEVGGDIDAVVDGIGSDHRIGSAFLRPGPGWGGSCFPKDTKGFSFLARTHGLDLPVAEAANTSNQIHLQHLVDAITNLLDSPADKAKVAVWGATFKAGTDDVRDSPAIEIVNRLAALGTSITIYDPAAEPELVPATMVGDPYSACLDADALLVLTEWDEFAAADLDKVAHMMRGDAVFDARYVIDLTSAERHGLRVTQPGKPRRNAITA